LHNPLTGSFRWNGGVEKTPPFLFFGTAATLLLVVVTTVQHPSAPILDALGFFAGLKRLARRTQNSIDDQSKDLPQKA
jgi:hypothetical protein